MADRGWWLLNIEFQPSGWRKDVAYLNVGEQHLWVERDHLVFELFERPLGGTTTVELSGSDDIERLVKAAADTATRRMEAHSEGSAALRRIADRRNDDLNAGIAAALLGREQVAQAKLRGQIHDVDRPLAERYAAALDGGTVETFALETVRLARTRLRLPASEHTWRTSQP